MLEEVVQLACVPKISPPKHPYPSLIMSLARLIRLWTGLKSSTLNDVGVGPKTSKMFVTLM